ncbi:MAG: type I-C CRISPR-associated endonuclease Cas1c [Defluviitaleaceae bacterium]|nr:type I-C CRISPR-associated endonuclease Cas1c [Defluviitaleaceae bacterium]
MKKLLNTLYVNTPGVYLSLDGENLVVSKDKESIFRIPLHGLEGICCFGYSGASPALMHACTKGGIDLSFFKPSGRFLARVTGETYGNLVLRKKQYATSEEPQCLPIAVNFTLGKLHNSRWVIERVIRDHPMRVDTLHLKNKIEILKDMIEKSKLASSLDTLRGFEGVGAKAYFSIFDNLILQQKDSFHFDTRSRRPPLDNVNAMLSFMYSLFAKEIASSLESVGLDPYVGFLHRDRPGRMSLALDMLEELRPMVDRFVLSLINKKEVKKEDFYVYENGAVKMEDDARKTILTSWQQRKNESLEHRFLKEKINWGLVPFVQSSLLARHLRGDIDEYVPFLWK